MGDLALVDWNTAVVNFKKLNCNHAFDYNSDIDDMACVHCGKSLEIVKFEMDGPQPFASPADFAKRARGCKLCPALVASRTRVVLPEGGLIPPVKILFVGEAPGRDEDAEGRPFVGASGDLLREALGEQGFIQPDTMQLLNCAITNTVMCRPKENRNPNHFEIRNCRHYLDYVVETLNPWMLCALGRIAMWEVIPSQAGMSITGSRRLYWNDDLKRPAAAMPHPSFFLRRMEDEGARAYEDWQRHITRVIELLNTEVYEEYQHRGVPWPGGNPS